MKIVLIILAVLCILTLIAFMPLENEVPPARTERLYEMRIYYAEPGKLDDLLARFRNHITKLFEKYGMTNEGYWLPIDNRENRLIYVLSYPNREVREKAWQDFQNDSEWKQVAKSEENRKVVARIDNYFMQATDFSPGTIAKTGTANRVFELRPYQATPGNLPALLARFRNHTTQLFEKHGMTNLWYWTYTDKESGADDMLLYMVAHPSQEAGQAAFNKFREDPVWQKVREESEIKAGGSLTVSLASVYMTPTDFSPVK